MDGQIDQNVPPMFGDLIKSLNINFIYLRVYMWPDTTELQTFNPCFIALKLPMHGGCSCALEVLVYIQL